MAKKVGIPFTIDTELVAEGKAIPSDCNDILFINQGQCPVRINRAIYLQQGGSWGPGGNSWEFDTTIYDVAFEPVSVPSTATQELVVVRKTYNANPGDQWVYPTIAALAKNQV